MESIAVEAIRQLPALILAVLAIYLYRSANRATELSRQAPAIPADLLDNVEAIRSRTDQMESDLKDVQSRFDEYENAATASEEEAESIRSQLSNQKMALKEFGRVLSVTSEQTYTEFGTIDERIQEIEGALSERGLLNQENRSAAA